VTEIHKTPEDNRKVYSGFLGYTKWVIVLVLVALIALLMFTYGGPPAAK
jgi:hypothetical protein